LLQLLLPLPLLLFELSALVLPLSWLKTDTNGKKCVLWIHVQIN
jgi:hypothetical protein